MMQEVIVEGIKKQYSEEKLVSEILEIMNMISLLEKKMLKTKSSRSIEKIEALLQTLRLEMTKRTVLLASRHGLSIRLPTASSLNNGGGSIQEPFYSDFSRLEEELNKAYRAARDMLNNLSRLV